MSFGKMNSFIEIVSATQTKDSEGFATIGNTTLANVRAYFEPKNATEKWSNRAVFAEANALFRFRRIPGLDVTTEMVIIHDGKRYGILSAENVRDMYVEVLGKAVDASG
jgi:head-tail adaptor